jgi:hypothetical protein
MARAWCRQLTVHSCIDAESVALCIGHRAATMAGTIATALQCVFQQFRGGDGLFRYRPDPSEGARLRTEFERDGYVHIKGALPPTTTTAMTQVSDESLAS